jgi:hypothetical protein
MAVPSAGEVSLMHGASLSSHRFLMRFALAAGNVFAWVFAFRAFYLASASVEASIFAIAALYAMMQGIVLILTPLSGAALRHGMRRALAYGTLVASFAFACFSLVFAPQVSAEFAFAMAASFVILMGIHRALYWVPYRTEAAHGVYIRASHAQEIFLAFVPLAAGIIIEIDWLGPEAILAAAALIALSALIPLIRIPESYEGFEWGFLESFYALFSPFNRSFLSLSIFDGIQGVTLLLVWPLAAFIIIGQSFLGLGFILTATLLMAPLARHLTRRLLNKLRAHDSTPVLVSLVFSSWILRLAAASPLQILVADVYYHSGVSPKRFSVDAPVFDQTADGAHYVDEYTALKEMGMAIGRIIACLILAASVYYLPAAGAFAFLIIVTAFAAAWSVIISRRLAKGV